MACGLTLEPTCTRCAALPLPRRNRLDALSHDAYKKSQAQCACMAPSRRGSHPSFDCALDGPGMFGGLEDSYVNRPANCECLLGGRRAGGSGARCRMQGGSWAGLG